MAKSSPILHLTDIFEAIERPRLDGISNHLAIPFSGTIKFPSRTTCKLECGSARDRPIDIRSSWARCGPFKRRQNDIYGRSCDECLARRLFDFAFLPNFDDLLTNLAENLAEYEDWEYHNTANTHSALFCTTIFDIRIGDLPKRIRLAFPRMVV